MAQSDIYLCFECGTKNRVGSDNRSGAKCGSCGAYLFQDQARSKTRAVSEKAQAEKKDGSGSGGAQAIFWILVGLVALVGWALYSPGADSKKSVVESNTSIPASQPETLSIAQPAPVFDEPVVSQAPGIIWNKTNKKPEAPFQIITSAGSDYFVKLENAYTGEDAVAVYVNGGRRTSVEVPLGSYRMKYATGKIWYGENHLFGPEDTSFYSSNDIMNFRVQGNYINGYTVELIRQVGGNLETRPISANDF